MDVVGAGAAAARRSPGQIDPVAAGRAGPHRRAGRSSQLAAAWLGRGGDRAAPARPHHPRARALPGPRSASIPRAWRRLTAADRRTARLVPLSSLARPMPPTGDGELHRENLRQMAPGHRRGSKGATWGARSPRSRASCAASSCRSATRSRSAASTSRSARPSASCCWCFGIAAVAGAAGAGGRVPRLHPGAHPPARGAALASAAPSCSCCSPARSSTSPPPWG